MKHKAVYPGHPIKIAHIITEVFDSFEAATKKGTCYSAAMESNDVPGAGGNVASALEILGYLVKQTAPVDKAIQRGDDIWKAECSTAYRDRYEEGQKQADEVKPMLIEKLKTWGKA